MGRLLWSAAKFLLLTPLCVHAGSNARDSDLEQRGARIGAIEIQVDDVFESTTRLGSARSGLGNVLHIDLAFPLDRSSDIDSMQLLIETRKSF